MLRFCRYIFAIVVFLSAINGFSQPDGVKITQQQTKEKTRILFIVDCSYNMNEKWQSDTKFKITQSYISNIIDTLAGYKNVELALRVFGNDKDFSLGDCDDTHLLVPFYQNNGDVLKSRLKAIVPKGTSAVANSLLRAESDFPQDDHCRNIVIMIVDNIDKCGGNIEEISLKMQKNGKYIKPFIIGISKGMKNNYSSQSVYYEAENEIEFNKILNSTVKQALDKTTVQVNLLDAYMEVTETNVPITFYDSKSKNLRYSFIHTFNSKGGADTLMIDPLVKYDVIVHTIPEVKAENVSISAGSHTIIPIKAPQGNMIIKYTSSSKTFAPKTYPVIVKQAGKKETVNTHQLNTKEKYLVGKYDLEVLCVPRLNIAGVEVSQSSTTTIEIPVYGTLRLDKGKTGIIASLFVKNKQETRWVMNLDYDKSKENIDLMPGEYIIVAREESAMSNQYTVVKEVKIESEKTTNVSLFNKNIK